MHRSMSVCVSLDQKYSKSISPRVIRFGQGMNVDDPKVNLKGQGHKVIQKT